MPGSPHDVLRAPVSVGYARALLRHLGETAAQRATLLAGTGITEQALADPSAEMPVARLVALAANITRRHGELWALDAHTVWSHPLQGALDVASRTAATVGDALESGARYGPVRAPFVRARLHRSARAIRLEIMPAFSGEAATWRAIALAVSLNLNAVYSAMLEDAVAQTTLAFPWPAPAAIARLKPLYACRLKFGAKSFSYEVPRSLCERVSPFADPQLHAKAVEALEAAARRGPDAVPLAQAVEHMIAARLPHRLGEDEAARLMGLSRRTLVRRLGDDGHAFRPLLDGVLRERAQVMLADARLSRDAMASALGYADATSFSRACRRWFGGTRAVPG